jgi:hypothetical protein
MDKPSRTISVLLLVLLAGGCGGSTSTMTPDLSMPPVDLMPGPCNRVPLPAATITIQQGTGNPPGPTGGSIVDGTYLLTQAIDYSVGDALIGQSTAGEMIVANGTIQSVSSDPKGGTVRVNATYTIMGTSLQQTGTCGFSDSFSQGVSATDTTLTLIQAMPPLMTVFTRQ